MIVGKDFVAILPIDPEYKMLPPGPAYISSKEKYTSRVFVVKDRYEAAELYTLKTGQRGSNLTELHVGTSWTSSVERESKDKQ